jgi:diaminopimelate decarboxylase
VRVNPDFELKSSGMKMGGGAKQFGVDAEQVPELLAEIGRSGLAFEGFHLFAGSQNLQTEAIVEAQGKSYELAVRLAQSRRRASASSISAAASAFPTSRRAAARPDAGRRQFAASQNVPAASCRPPNWSSNWDAIWSAKPASTSPASSIASSRAARSFLVADGGLHHHLSASGNFGQVIRKNYPVAIGNRVGAPTSITASLVGPLCTPLDLLADRMPLADAQPGDLAVIFQSGAYGFSASPQAFLGHPTCLEVIV